MAKKRKTRQEKIILQLKRQLAQEKGREVVSASFERISQGAKVKAGSEAKPKKAQTKKTYKSVFFYDSALVKKDLIKVMILTLGIISLEFVLYLKLR